MSRRILTISGMALATVLATAPHATAQDAAPPAPSAQVSGGVAVQTREDEIGDLRRYVSETTTTARMADGTSHERYNRQQFDLETMAVTASGLLVRFTLREAEARDLEQPFAAAFLQGWIGIPIEVETSLSGAPQRIVNWTRVRDSYAAALTRLMPDHVETATGLTDALGAMEETPRAAAIVADLALLASAQPRGMVREGRVDAPSQTTTLADSRTVTVNRYAGYTPAGGADCLARFQSGVSMALNGASSSSSETVEATLSSFDGWVVALEERTTTVGEPGRIEKVVTVKRDDPGCQAAT